MRAQTARLRFNPAGSSANRAACGWPLRSAIRDVSFARSAAPAQMPAPQAAIVAALASPRTRRSPVTKHRARQLSGAARRAPKGWILDRCTARLAARPSTRKLGHSEVRRFFVPPATATVRSARVHAASAATPSPRTGTVRPSRSLIRNRARCRISPSTS